MKTACFKMRQMGTIALVGLSALFTGCLQDAEVKVGNSEPIVSSVSLVDGEFIVDGTHLNKVEGLRIGSIVLQISTQSSHQLKARATSSLNIVAGIVYNLLVSTASAETTYPISITIPDGSLSVSALAGGSATAGQVLKYNGSAWVPAANNPSGGLYLAYLNGTIIGQLVTWIGGNTLFVWDDADGVMVVYENTTGGVKIHEQSQLEYATSDCSGTAYKQTGSTVDMTNIPNAAFVFAGVLHKVSVTSESVSLVAYKNSSGVCNSMSVTSGTFFQVTPIASPGVPLSLATGSFKFMKQ
jgi:hypothetical protein